MTDPGAPGRGAIVDTHVHLASTDTQRYPLSPSGGSGTHWWRDPLTAEGLLERMDAVGVGRTVVVHSLGAYRYDCRYTIDALAVAPHRLRAVAAVDMGGPDPVADLVALAAAPGVTGVRVMATAAGPDGWFDLPVAHAVWDAAAAAGVAMVVVVLEDRVAGLEDLVAARPDTAVVIDHCGMPELPDGVLMAGHPVLALATHQRVHVKVSTPVLLRAAAVGAPARLVHQLVEAYGAGRVMWGSDLPQTDTLDYPEMVALLDEACAGLSPADRDAVCGGSADALFFHH